MFTIEIMFIALIVWSFTTYLHVSFLGINHKTAAKKGEELWQSKLSSVALRFGLIGNLCLAFLFFPVTRGSSILSFGLTSEASIKYHIWLGHIVMTLFTSHGVCYIIYWIVTKQTSERIKKHGFIDVANRKRRRELLRLNLVKQEEAGDPDAKGHNDVTKRNDVQPQERKVMDKKIKEMKDQLIRAKAYLSFALPAGNTHLIKELRLRVKELEQAMGDVGKDSDLSKRAFQRMRAMENSLQKAGRIYPDCSSMVKKLRAMTNIARIV
ncbi:putative ferric-chelate reductase (NADH) [Helianthus annuus]|nr:putative ferric-chelate reductase (NADH) [Helianthus annuus]KAJ0540922.1 putative ferric-chelate reductase (NADH) [Helianthus annuus]